MGQEKRLNSIRLPIPFKKKPAAMPEFLGLFLVAALIFLVVACSGTATTPVKTTAAVLKYRPFPGNIILGRPTADYIAVSLLASENLDVYIQYGRDSGIYKDNSAVVKLAQGQPTEIELSNLVKDTLYYYRVCHRVSGETVFSADTEYTFRTQRVPGSTFSFGIQGDSHPERTQIQFNPDLYNITLNHAKEAKPDFYMTIGDDFSVDIPEIKANPTLQNVEKLYVNQRNWLGTVGSASPIFLVNGNHEQAAKYLLNGTPDSIAVYSGNSRNKYFPLPAPNTFYSGDAVPVENVGLPRDYYAWTWGDALFVVIDFYWHSPVCVDNYLYDAGPRLTDLWKVTLDENQYKWFEKTLAESQAKYKFVFTHQVLGTNRGGIGLASGFEWGGKRTNSDVDEFAIKRPGWDMPIHQLMVKNNVTIFFHGHDHLYAREELDGIVYQELPAPADYLYGMPNSSVYKGFTLPCTGFVNVTVAPTGVKVDYINSFLPKDVNNNRKDGQLAYSYTIQK